MMAEVEVAIGGAKCLRCLDTGKIPDNKPNHINHVPCGCQLGTLNIKHNKRDWTPEDDRMGWWLSAALEDPKVCEKMKADIKAWFDQYKSVWGGGYK
jgi:hypothetical protein